MPAKRLRDFLDRRGVRYETLVHPKAYTAQGTAESAHIPGREIAKTVMIKIDCEMAMTVLPAPRSVDLEVLREVTGARRAELASEAEFRDLCPACEIGAMPPFGNLYGMNVYVDRTLAEDGEVAFNAGSHTELIRMRYVDFEKLVKPIVLSFSMCA